VAGAIEQLERLVAQADASPLSDTLDDHRPPIDLPTRYGGPDGPDLDEVASIHGLRAVDVVELHASVAYRVFFLGFAPGFAYLGPLPGELATPRLATPRPRVPAGSVGIAGTQTAVYPVDSPGGWRLIGRTDARVWDPSADPPAMLLPGRRVRFVPAGG
jgi:KipI family sensor histidine kinase inhibitor